MKWFLRFCVVFVLLLIGCSDSSGNRVIQKSLGSVQEIYYEQEVQNNFVRFLKLHIPNGEFTSRTKGVTIIDLSLNGGDLSDPKQLDLSKLIGGSMMRIVIVNAFGLKESLVKENSSYYDFVLLEKNVYGLKHYKRRECRNVPFPENIRGEGEVIGECYSYRAQDFYVSDKLAKSRQLTIECGIVCIIRTELHDFKMSITFAKEYLEYWRKIYTYADKKTEGYVVDHGSVKVAN